jgi:arabinofuranan 3-O-arabinosyltransferase
MSPDDPSPKISEVSPQATATKPIMHDALELPRSGAERGGQSPPLLGIFAAWRLQAYAYAIAFVYLVAFAAMYRAGGWIVNGAGAPIYTDFTSWWIAGLQSLHGDLAPLYDPTQFINLQTTILGKQVFLYPNWPYPPSFALLITPFARLPYARAFVAWNLLTLLGGVAVIYVIVRRSPAIALVLASPFTAWNILCAQNGLLTASLLGAALLCFEYRPVLAGAFVGCLTYKPQFGILIPVALVAAKEWRVIASAVATWAALAVASALVFGGSAWEAFPQGLLTPFNVVLRVAGPADNQGNWGYIDTVYGLIRYVHGGPRLAWAVQGIVTLCAAAAVWQVWHSPARYALKAATLSAAALLATPYAFAYDFAAVAVPIAFLARDQMCCGVLRGEQTTLLLLFSTIVVLLLALGDPRIGLTFGSLPVGPVVIIAILGLVLRRVVGSATAIARHPKSLRPATSRVDGC